MKPNHLKSPYRWNNRAVLIKDQVWYVPEYYDQYEQFTFPGWESLEIFGNANPIHVEYCSGNGAWIAAKASAHPEINWVAIEKKFERVRKIWSKIKNYHLANLFVICGEGYSVTKHYFPSESISSVYVNFPDPWPKNTHAKHRIIQPLFIQEMERVMKQGTSLTLVTDDMNYSRKMITTLQKNPSFTSIYPSPYYITDWPEYGSSYFEQLWREEGKEILFHKFEKRKQNETHS